jgi:hypothetical protein
MLNNRHFRSRAREIVGMSVQAASTYSSHTWFHVLSRRTASDNIQ